MTGVKDDTPDPLGVNDTDNPLATGPADIEEASGVVDDGTAKAVEDMAKDAAADKIADPFADAAGQGTSKDSGGEGESSEEGIQTKDGSAEALQAKLAELEELKAVVANIEEDPTLMAMLEDYYANKGSSEGTQISTDTGAPAKTTPPKQTDPQALQAQLAAMQAQLQVEQYFGTHPDAQPYRAAMAEIATKNPGIQDLDLLLKLARTQQGEESNRSLQSAEKGSAAPRRGESTTQEELQELIEKSNTNNLEKLASKAAEALWRNG
jgi:hypothetical protein